MQYNSPTLQENIKTTPHMERERAYISIHIIEIQ